MSVATQQTGEFIMARCQRCGQDFSCRTTYASRTMYCDNCAREMVRIRSAKYRRRLGAASRATGVSPAVTVENRGTIPGGNIHAVRPMTASPLKRIYYP